MRESESVCLCFFFGNCVRNVILNTFQVGGNMSKICSINTFVKCIVLDHVATKWGLLPGRWCHQYWAPAVWVKQPGNCTAKGDDLKTSLPDSETINVFYISSVKLKNWVKRQCFRHFSDTPDFFCQLCMTYHPEPGWGTPFAMCLKDPAMIGE